MPPSSSDAEPEQVSVVEVSTPVLGEMEAVTVGAVFPTVTEAVPVPVPPSASVAVVVQVMVSSGELVDVVRVTDAVEPSDVPSVELVQA